MLKHDLMENLSFNDEHPYKIFCNWRFKDSVRNEDIFKRNLARIRQKKIQSFNFPGQDTMMNNLKSSGGGGNARSVRKSSNAGSESENLNMDGNLEDPDDEISNDQLYNMDSSNVIVASWLNNLGYPEKQHEDKFLFFNNETLLNNRDILEHFN